MDQSFSNRPDYLAAVSQALSEHSAPPAIQTAIFTGVVEAEDSLLNWREQDNPGQELRLGRWYIRNDDFPYLKLIAAVASATIAVAATGGIAAASLVEPIATFAAACWKVKRKGTMLSTEQVAVLCALNTTGLATIEQLRMSLTSSGY